MEWKEKRWFVLTLLPQSGWLHQHATKVPCLAFLLVWPLSSICRTCHRIIQNTSTSQCLTAKCHDLLPPFFTCCPLHLCFEISNFSWWRFTSFTLENNRSSWEMWRSLRLPVRLDGLWVNWHTLSTFCCLTDELCWKWSQFGRGEDHLPSRKSLCENFKMIR